MRKQELKGEEAIEDIVHIADAVQALEDVVVGTVVTAVQDVVVGRGHQDGMVDALAPQQEDIVVGATVPQEEHVATVATDHQHEQSHLEEIRVAAEAVIVLLLKRRTQNEI